MDLQNEVHDRYIEKLKNRLFGVLCEREKKGDWEKFLDSIVIELNSMIEESPTINLLTISHKLHTLKYLNYEYFRRTIFECMNLLSIEQEE